MYINRIESILTQPPLFCSKFLFNKKYLLQNSSSGIKNLRFVLGVAIILLNLLPAKAQNVALKTNLAYDATASVNLGLEFAMSRKWTMDVSGNLNAWNMPKDMKWKHWFVQPEARYWFCEKFGGHFLGIHAQAGQFNVGGIKNNIKFLGTDFSKLTDSRYQGWMAGGGISYGYAFILGRSWNLELEVGVGYNYTLYDRFECAGCGRKVEEDQEHHYVGPTKAAINLVYLF